ncbi:hypothetical protein DL96DRAFT_1817587 [Flagelloscypha sp. PMI_526]|nr:hypothetical protein DL96DRAFT_1817587 [Flagelloscypha sp. PMI_526]
MSHSPSSSSNGHNFPDLSMQNYAHELAKTLPPPRKQNTACDACRARKVKCHRIAGQEKCQHCHSKGLACTNKIQQETAEKKRATSSRKPKPAGSGHVESSPPATNDGPATQSIGETPMSGPPPSLPTQPLAVRYGFSPQINVMTPVLQVLEYLFSPPETLFSMPIPGTSSAYLPWGEDAYRLAAPAFRFEFTLDLIEVFFQIVHTRLPLLSPTDFRRRIALNPQQTGVDPPHPAILAAVVAWGAKYSEHPVLLKDRKRPDGQSELAKALVQRARDLAEGLRVHRIPSEDHVVACLLIEPLQNQNPDDPGGYHGFWLSAAIRHLFILQVNHKTTMSQVLDTEKRGTLIFAWWMALIADAYAASYYRRKPVLDDDDYDIDFYTADSVPTEPESQGSQDSSEGPSTREQLEFLGYYRAAHALARISRTMAKQLWKPSSDSEGIPLQYLVQAMNGLTSWRTEFLEKVGVPKNYSGNWNFMEAVTSCASDATYHVMWVILFGAVDDFGIKEVNDVLRVDPSAPIPNGEQIKMFKQRLVQETDHAALRIAGLTSVLAKNGYLRLDTAVVHVAIIEAGKYLARQGRREAANCIEGLKQYSIAYEETGEAALEIRRIWDGVHNSGEKDLNHMGPQPRITRNSPTLNTSSGSTSHVQPMDFQSTGDQLQDVRRMMSEESFQAMAAEPLF